MERERKRSVKGKEKSDKREKRREEERKGMVGDDEEDKSERRGSIDTEKMDWWLVCHSS